MRYKMCRIPRHFAAPFRLLAMLFKVSSLWLAAVLGRSRKILDDDDSMNIYRLPASPFTAGSYKGAPYQPAGLFADQLAHLHLFLAHAEGIVTVDERAAFIEGRGGTGTGDHLGRNLYCAWFKTNRIQDRINDLYDIVLAEAEMTPEGFIKDRAIALSKGELPEFDTKMPKLSVVKAACADTVVEAVFGAAAQAKRGLDAQALFACNSIWSHQWKRYEKKRSNAIKNHESAREAYEKKRDGEWHLCVLIAGRLLTPGIAALPPMPSKKDIQQLMTATRKFMSLGAWALDLASEIDGPVEAEAFLRGAMEAVGVNAEKAPVAKGPRHKVAGTSVSASNVKITG